MKTRRKTAGGKGRRSAHASHGARRRAQPAAARATPRPASKGVRETRVALAADCSIAQVAAFKKRLEALLERPAPVTLDASEVRRIDGAAAQLLAAFVRERRSRGLAVSWAGNAEPVREAAQLLGLAAWLD